MTGFRLLSAAVLVALSLWPAKASAFKRAAQPLSVAVAQADAIVVAQPTRVPSPASLATPDQRDSADILIAHVIKGTLPEGTFTVLLHEHYPRVQGALQLDQKYIFFLRAAPNGQAGMEVILTERNLTKTRRPGESKKCSL